MRVTVRLVVMVCLSLGLTPSAWALNPEQAVTGATGTNWYSGGLIQQYGENCSTAILGSSYSEVMTSGVGSYGGTAGVVTQQAPYWASILLSVPGNPCGSGSAGLQTDLFLPPGTAIDTARQIRCFGLPRNVSDAQNGWVELTGSNWSLQGVGSGPYCPASAPPAGSSTLAGGGYQLGFRLVASGQLYKMFVPVISTQLLSGGSGQVIDWLVSSTAAYANPALTRTGAFIFPASIGAGTNPTVFFSREPAAVPYWTSGVAENRANRVELFVNVYTAGKAGNLSYEIRRTDDNSVVWSSALAGASWNGSVAAGQSVVQLNPAGEAVGPNGGYSPVYFDPPGTPGNPRGEWNVPMRITWTFTPSSGAPVSGATDFRTLSGPDRDGDGVPDASDTCPDQKGDGSNGCTAVGATNDSDLDRVTGAADRCPTVPAPGTPDGCPVAELATAPGSGANGAGVSGTTVVPAAAAPSALLSTKAKSTLPKARLLGRSGAAVTASCTAGATATFMLTATKSAAKALKLKSNPLPVLASATAACRAGSTSAVLKLSKKLAPRVRANRTVLTATLSVVATGPGGSSPVSSVPVRLK